MSELDLFQRLAVALAIGLLVGLERGWQAREEEEGGRTAGLRTFALTGLLGGIAGALFSATGPLIPAAIFLAFAGAFTWFSWYEATSERNFSVTGVVAALLTFALGTYAMLGEIRVAIAAAVAAALLLALKKTLHSWLQRLTWLEIRAVLILLAMSFLLLPVLPDHTVDPWDALNPAEIWLLAILIAALSFAGYIAVRLIGDRAGIAIAAIAGGLTSSTATTVSFARWAVSHDRVARLLAGGILLSGLTMLIRIVVIAGALKPAMIPALAVPVAAAGIVMLVSGALLILRRPAAGETPPKLDLKNPFDLGTAVKMAALIAVIMLFTKLASTWFGSSGVFVLAALSGIADVDALTLSMARLGGTQLPLGDATAAILLAAAVNTVSKTVLATWIGGRALGLWVAIPSTLAIAALGAAHVYLQV